MVRIASTHQRMHDATAAEAVGPARREAIGAAMVPRRSSSAHWASRLTISF
jgi:hypothetical protein